MDGHPAQAGHAVPQVFLQSHGEVVGVGDGRRAVEFAVEGDGKLAAVLLHAQVVRPNRLGIGLQELVDGLAYFRLACRFAPPRGDGVACRLDVGNDACNVGQRAAHVALELGRLSVGLVEKERFADFEVQFEPPLPVLFVDAHSMRPESGRPS